MVINPFQFTVLNYTDKEVFVLSLGLQVMTRVQRYTLGNTTTPQLCKRLCMQMLQASPMLGKHAGLRYIFHLKIFSPSLYVSFFFMHILFDLSCCITRGSRISDLTDSMLRKKGVTYISVNGIQWQMDITTFNIMF